MQQGNQYLCTAPALGPPWLQCPYGRSFGGPSYLCRGGANISFTQKASAQASLDRTVPFDIVGCLDPSADYAYDFDQAGDIIESVVPVRETLDYNVYIDGTRPVTSAVGFTVAYDNGSSVASLMEQSGPPDYYVRLSDFNRFAEALGQETLPKDCLCLLCGCRTRRHDPGHGYCLYVH